MNLEKGAERVKEGGFELSEPYNLLFTRINQEGISWCSWKSNEHLVEGLKGTTDIDFLFYEYDRGQVEKILRECGFVYFQTPSWRAYPGIVDYISTDIRSGRILHAHCHFLLCTGEKYLKSYILPWNSFILQNRIQSDLDFQIYIAPPVVETILLFVRESLKIRYRDRLRTHPNDLWGGESFKKELKWLVEKVTPHKITDCAKELLGEDSSEILLKMTFQQATFKDFLSLRAAIKKTSTERQWRRMQPGWAILQVGLRETVFIIARISEKYRLFRHVIIRRRILPGGGLAVAFVGPDGAGKSTVTKTVVSEWENKIDVARIYFGTGEGSQTLIQWVVKKIFSIGLGIKKIKGKQQTNKSISSGKAASRPSWGTMLSAISSASSKKKLMSRVGKLKKRGFIVICDRWPQNQVANMNDGPMLFQYKGSSNFLYRNLAIWEEKQFRQICAHKPDIVVRLIPSLETAVSRKKENEAMRPLIAQKIESLRNIHFSDSGQDYFFDADLPLGLTLTKIRSLIWTHLQKREAPALNSYECFGLPGAGKTTACSEICKTKSIKSVQDVFSPSAPISKIRKCYLTLCSFFWDPVIYMLALKVIFDLQLWRNKESASYIIKIPVQKLRLKKEVEREPHLIEQLLLQNIWSALVAAGVKKTRPEILAPFIERIYRDLKIIILYFDIPVSESAKRISGRKGGASRFDSLAVEEIKESLTEPFQLARNVIQSASYAGLDVVYIEATAPAHVVLEKLNRTLQSLGCLK